MAEGIYRRGEGQWLVRIRRQGQSIARTFETFEAAREFRDITVGRITGREYVDRTREQRETLKDLLDRYLKEVTPTKKGALQETNLIKHWQAEPFATWSLVSVQQTDIVAWRDQRKAAGRAPSTISNAMNLLSAVYKHAVGEWGYKLTNPCVGVKRPTPRPGRNVKLTTEYETKLIAACEAGPPYLVWCVRLAIETAMRQGEIRRLRWEHIGEYTIHLPMTKNNTARDVPLTEEAAEVITGMRAALPRRLDGWVFGDPDVSADEGGFTRDQIQQAFRDAVKAAGIPHITFHDLRHVATTRLAEFHRDALELAKTTGHKTLAVLARYYNPDPEERAKEIRARKRQARAGV